MLWFGLSPTKPGIHSMTEISGSGTQTRTGQHVAWIMRPQMHSGIANRTSPKQCRTHDIPFGMLQTEHGCGKKRSRCFSGWEWWICIEFQNFQVRMCGARPISAHGIFQSQRNERIGCRSDANGLKLFFRNAVPLAMDAFGQQKGAKHRVDRLGNQTGSRIQLYIPMQVDWMQQLIVPALCMHLRGQQENKKPEKPIKNEPIQFFAAENKALVWQKICCKKTKNTLKDLSGLERDKIYICAHN